MKMNETVAGLTITAKTEGVDQAKKQVDGLTQSTEQLGVVSQQTSKSTLSLEDAWKKQTLRMDEAARAQANMARETKIADAALREGIATQAQHAQRLAEINQRYGQASVGAKAFAAATSGVSGQLIALSAGAGPVGVFLSALGPWGMAASVGLGAVAAVFERINEGAKRVGDKSIELKKFSDVTGLSVTEVKGLTKAGAELGVSSDDIKTSVEHFSVGLDEARRGSGALFEQIMRINPALAQQLALAPNAAKGWDIVAQAIKGATDAAQRNALSRAAFGRGGLETGQVAAATVDKGGVEAMGAAIAKNTGLTKEWVEETARLSIQNEELQKAITATMDASFALPTLRRQNEYLKAQKEIVDLWAKGGGFKAPAADDFGAAFVAASTPPPLSQRGPSEGAMQAQEEAKAQREIAEAVEKINKARESGQLVQAMQLTIALETGQAEKRKAEVFEQNRVAYSNVSAMTAQILAQLNDQLGVAQAITGVARMEAQEYATINSLLAQGKTLVDAIAIAEAQRAISIAQVNAAADQTLKNLQQQGQLLQAGSEWEKARIQAAQEYNKLLEQGVDSLKAGAIAAQMQANARSVQDAKDIADAERETANAKEEQTRSDEARNSSNRDHMKESERDRIDAAEADAKAASEAQRHAAANERAAQAMQREAEQAARAAAEWERLWQVYGFVPWLGEKVQYNAMGQATQFNPEGYQSTGGNTGWNAIMQTLNQKRDPMAGFNAMFTQATTQTGGNLAAAVGSMIGKGGIFTGDEADPQRLALLERAIALMSKDEQIGTIRGLMGQLGAAPQTLQTAEMTKQLGDQLTELTKATDANTAATQTQTDVLSPLYSSDPRGTHLGFRAFAGGGIMTQYGELPLRQYQGGGIATSPQVAVFGEGSTPEAYVPAPAGRIPVEIKGAANSNQRPITVTINVMGNADSSTVAALKQTGFQRAQELRRVSG